jgi:polyhydroxyalkanoate synthesis regulator protein
VKSTKIVAQLQSFWLQTSRKLISSYLFSPLKEFFDKQFFAQLSQQLMKLFTQKREMPVIDFIKIQSRTRTV